MGTTEHTEHTEARNVGPRNTRKQEETDCGLYLGGESREIGTFRTLQKHGENMQKFGSCPLRCKTLVFPGFFAFLANCFGFPARPCTCMLAHAASSSALPCPLVSRPVSRQSRLRTLVFPGKTGGFAVEVVGFELGEEVLSCDIDAFSPCNDMTKPI